MTRPSHRILEAVEALPLEPGMRVLEIGCGPGAAAREVARLVGPDGFVLGIDRSERAVSQAQAAAAGHDNLAFEVAAIEHFDRPDDRAPFDVAFALRVGALDGRHPQLEAAALQAVARALRPQGRLFIDGGSPLRELALPR